jgi:hypothetical protein
MQPGVGRRIGSRRGSRGAIVDLLAAEALMTIV